MNQNKRHEYVIKRFAGKTPTNAPPVCSNCGGVCGTKSAERIKTHGYVCKTCSTGFVNRESRAQRTVETLLNPGFSERW